MGEISLPSSASTAGAIEPTTTGAPGSWARNRGVVASTSRAYAAGSGAARQNRRVLGSFQISQAAT